MVSFQPSKASRIMNPVPFLCLFGASVLNATAAPPNVLIFFADDLGQRDLVCYHP